MNFSSGHVELQEPSVLGYFCACFYVNALVALTNPTLELADVYSRGYHMETLPSLNCFLMRINTVSDTWKYR